MGNFVVNFLIGWVIGQVLAIGGIIFYFQYGQDWLLERARRKNEKEMHRVYAEYKAKRDRGDV